MSEELKTLKDIRLDKPLRIRGRKPEMMEISSIFIKANKEYIEKIKQEAISRRKT